MNVEAQTDPVELDEAGIPAEMLPRARVWFKRQVETLARQHGEHWPANREWLVSYLREELRELIAADMKDRHAP